jgi:hypothetical protein
VKRENMKRENVKRETWVLYPVACTPATWPLAVICWQPMIRLCLHLPSAVLGFDKPFGGVRRALNRRRLLSAVRRLLSAFHPPVDFHYLHFYTGAWNLNRFISLQLK